MKFAYHRIFMANIRSLSLCLVAIVFVLGAWQRPQPKAGIVRLNVDARSAHSLDSAYVIDHGKIVRHKLAGIRLDAAGKGKISFELGSARFLSIQFGDLTEEVFLAPGDELTIRLTGPHNYTFQYKGRGAAVNNYISLQNQRVEILKTLDGAYISYLKPEEFIERLDTVKKAIDAFHKGFNDTTALGKDIRAMLETRNEIKVASLVQDYACVQQINANGAGIRQFTFPDNVQILVKSFPIDTALLNLGQPDYQHLLQRYLIRGIHLPIYSPQPGRSQGYPTAAARRITQGNYPYRFGEYLSAINVQHWMSSQGLTPSTDSAFYAFKAQYTTSWFTGSLEKMRTRLLRIAKGKPAINFTGVDPQGDSVSLEMFRGKVVYVDVWATWCGGCIQEIPSSISLQQQYKNKVVFLNVSTDQNAAGWRNMLTKRSDWQGIHMLNNGSIMQSYGFSALPRYMLIDPNGKIISADAPRPSSPTIRQVIDAALQ
jgi:thiol-disulfide isomerase/thioredoxin